jgi:hypothetical protein
LPWLPVSVQRSVVAVAVGGLVAVSGRVAYEHWTTARANTEFAALLQQANCIGIATRSQGAPLSGVPVGPIVVLVRDITTSASVAPYHVKTNLSWPVTFADAASHSLLVLLVDRILVDVRSYRPAGDDYQVVLHCTLVAWAERRTVADFSVRGSRPSDRAGLLTVFGLIDRVGSEPWPEAGRRLAAYSNRD